MKYEIEYQNGEYRVHKAGCRDLKFHDEFIVEAGSVEEAIAKSKQHDLDSSGGDESFADVYYKVLPCAK